MRRNAFVAILATVLIVPSPAAAQAATHVSDETSLRLALTAAHDGDTIVLDNDISLADGHLPAITAGTLTLLGNGFKLQVADPGAVVKSGPGTLQFGPSSTGITGDLTVTAGAINLPGDSVLRANATVALTDGTTLSFGAEDTYTHTVTLAGFSNLNVSANMTVTQSGAVADGAVPGSLVLAGGGTLVLTNPLNSFSGGTLVKEDSTLVIDRDAELGGGDLTLGDDTSGGTLQFAGSFTSGRNLTLGTGGGTLDTNGNDPTWVGAISGDGGLTKMGQGTLTLSSPDNSYTGATTVAEGRLRAGAANVFGTNSAVTVMEDSTLDLNNFDQTIGSLAGDGSVTLGTATLTTGTDDTDTEFDGVIRGAGGLVKTGAGTFTLTGANTYTGGTTIDDGTLVGNTTSLQGKIINNAALVFDQDKAGTFSGVISGTGDLTKMGAGTLTLAGDLPLTGLTDVAEGALVFHGKIGGSVAVEDGATLAGAGSIAGDLDVTGTVAPAAQSTIKVGGDLTLEPDSIYRVMVGANGRATTLIQGAGAATIDGAVIDVTIPSLPPTRVNQSLVLSASQGIDGTATPRSSNRRVDPYLVVGGGNDNLLVLVLARNDIPLSTAALSGNGRAAGAALDRLRTGAAGDLAIVTRELSVLDDASLGAALDAVAGEIHASLPQLAALDSEAATDLINAAIAVRGRPGSDVQASAARTAWGAGHRSWIQVNGQHASFAGSADVHGGAANLGGFAAGVDRTVADGWLIGGGGGYSTGKLTLVGLNGSGQMTTARGFGYVGYASGHWAAHAGAGLAWALYDTTRRLGFTARLLPEFGGQPIFGGVLRQADSTERGLTPEAWGNWQFAAGSDQWSVRPDVGLRYARYGRKAWTETGAHALSLSAPSQSLPSAQASVGLHVERAGNRTGPFGMVAYRRELTDGRVTETVQFSENPANTFVVDGLGLARDMVMGGFGFRMANANVNLAIGYQARHASGQTRNTINLVLGF